MIRMEGASASHVGQIREINEDRAMFSSSLGAVADGMGGHLGGEKAASIVIGELSEIDGPMSRQQLLDVVQDANRKVYEESSRPELRGMGTTVVAATLIQRDEMMTVVNVGDSRGYRLRGERFEQLTLDHSLVEELVRQGRLSAEEARIHPQRNVVTRAIGLAEEVDIDVFDLDAVAGDRFLLCSDGLINEVPVDTIAATLAELDDPAEAAERLVAMAVDEGGRDNVSVVVIDLVDDEIDPPERADEVVVVGPVFVEPTPTAPVQPIHVDPAPHVSSPPSASGRDRRSLLLLVAAVAAVIGLAVVAISWYSGNAYFVSETDGEVVIMKGRPDDIFPWTEPEVVSATGIVADELTDASRERLRQELVWSTLDDAEEFVDGLETTATDGG